jgi:hypothetical protein
VRCGLTSGIPIGAPIIPGRDEIRVLVPGEKYNVFYTFLPGAIFGRWGGDLARLGPHQKVIHKLVNIFERVLEFRESCGSKFVILDPLNSCALTKPALHISHLDITAHQN